MVIFCVKEMLQLFHKKYLESMSKKITSYQLGAI